MTIAEVSEICLAAFTGLTLITTGAAFLFKIGQVFDRMTSVGDKVNTLDAKVTEQGAALTLHGQTVSLMNEQLSDELSRIRGFVGMHGSVEDSRVVPKRVQIRRKSMARK